MYYTRRWSGRILIVFIRPVHTCLQIEFGIVVVRYTEAKPLAISSNSPRVLILQPPCTCICLGPGLFLDIALAVTFIMLIVNAQYNDRTRYYIIYITYYYEKRYHPVWLNCKQQHRLMKKRLKKRVNKPLTCCVMPADARYKLPTSVTKLLIGRPKMSDQSLARKGALGIVVVRYTKAARCWLYPAIAPGC